MTRKKPAKKKAASKKKSASKKKAASTKKAARRKPVKKSAARRAPARLARAAPPETLAVEAAPEAAPDALAAEAAPTPLEAYNPVTRELVSVPVSFVEQGTVPIRLDWTGLEIGDDVAPGAVIGHWIWQTGRTEIRAPAGCAGTVLDLRVPECDILDQPPSQVLLVLAQ
jgi:hypothetical protein